MRSEFIIYWFDDNLDFFNAEELKFKSIITELKDNWFTPKIKFFIDQDPWTSHRFLSVVFAWSELDFEIVKLPDYSVESIRGINFDNAELVVVDYNLSAEWKWDLIVQHIRDNQYYTDVLFYSSELPIPWTIPESARWEDPKEHNLRIKIGRDAVFCSARDKIFDKLWRVLKTIVKKMQWLNNLRWLVMAETAEIDEWHRKILIKICDYHSSTVTIEPSSNQRSNQVIKIWAHLLLKTNSNELTYRDIIYDLYSTNSARLYDWIFYFWRSSTLNTTWLCGSLDNFDRYINKSKRNILAHQPEEDTSTRDCMKICDTSTWAIVEFREQDLKDIRKYIREHKNLLINLYNKLP